MPKSSVMLKENVTAKEKVRKSKLMWSFLLSYLLILVIPISLCIAAYGNAIATINKNAASYHLSMLTQAKESLELRSQEARLIAMQIADDVSVNNLMYAMEHGGGTPFQIWECQQKLQQYTGTNQYISQALITVQKGHTAISTTYYHKDMTQGKPLTINGQANAILSPLFEYSPGKMVKAEYKDDKVNEDRTLMYVKTFPNGVVDYAYGNICLVLDQTKLEGLLKFSNQWTGGYNAILDENNQVLVYSGNNPEEVSELWLSFDKASDSYSAEHGGEKMSVTYLSSEETGWTYLSVYPQNQVLADTIQVRNLLILFITAAVAVGILASVILSRRNTRPVHQIITKLNGAVNIGDNSRAGSMNEYSIIQAALDGLIERNHSLSEQTRDQKTIVREAMFRVLLNGQTPDLTLFNSMADEVGIRLEDGCFIGIRFDFDAPVGDGISTNAERPLTEYIRKILSLRFDKEGHAYYLADNETLALLYFSGCGRLDVYTVIKEIISEVESAVSIIEKSGSGEDVRLVIGISNTYTNPTEVYRCAEEARFSAEYSKLFEFGRPVFYDMVSGSVNLFKFTLNDHQHLLNIVKAGNVEEAQKAFNELIERNIVQNRMNAEMVEQLFYAIKGLLLEGADFAGDENVKAKIAASQLKADDIFTSFLSLESAYISIAAEIGEKKNKKGHLLVNTICDSLEAEYSDANITLTSTADRFGISEAHLSKLFREYAKDSFASYLEGLRINKAKEMLAAGKLKMAQIAENTGYNSVESFRRAFKRLTGIAPSEYKEHEKN